LLQKILGAKQKNDNNDPKKIRIIRVKDRTKSQVMNNQQNQ
jgi:hypothetical protein